MRIIVDRIEENTAVVELEDGNTVNMPTKLLCGAKEGDAIILTVEKKEESVVDTHSIFESLRKKSKDVNLD